MRDAIEWRREFDDSVDTTGQEWGSDYVVDLLSAFGFEYVPFNPGASFRGLEESVVNYDDSIQVIETTHEGLSVSIAHGYAKASGEPAVCFLHDVVGTLHASMSIYNAYCDRVPVIAIAGTGPLRKSNRRPWIDWIHTALNQGELVAEFVKWIDQPLHLDGVAESLLRAYDVSTTTPMGPTYLTIDQDLQERRLEGPIEIPDLTKFSPPSNPGPDSERIEQAAERLATAENPVVVPGRVGDSKRIVEDLIEIVETVGAAVVDNNKYRYNFPNTHPLDLSYSDVHRDADVILALDVLSLERTLGEKPPDDAAVIEIGSGDLSLSKLTTDYGALEESAMSIVADVGTALPALSDALAARAPDPDEQRISALAERHERLFGSWKQAAAEEADAKPISLSRIATEVWEVIRDEQWTLVNGTLKGWTHKLWDVGEFEEYIGVHSGGGGMGYGIGAAIGAALAVSDGDRIPIDLQSDGDLMYYLSGLWTLGHYEVPLLTVMANNESYYNSTKHRLQLASHRGRDESLSSALVGTGLTDPTPDYARIAESMGINGYGPIEEPSGVRPALEEALADVKGGAPALVDVRCEKA